MENELLDILVHLLAAMTVGALIGLERSYNGHDAGFRTHTLVCMASSLLMLVAVSNKQWFSQGLSDTARIDPMRMAQGIMTGIGFLGAGVIMREGLSVRGLTTAASIWITAAIGILAGLGLYSAVGIVLVLTLGTLSLFRWIETRLPKLTFAQCQLSLNCEDSISEKELRDILGQQGFDIVSLGYTFMHDKKCLSYDMMISARGQRHFELLSRKFLELKSVLDFRISLTGD
jgi:putative Mg2+ transporter-C (MgtC) family protein